MSGIDTGLWTDKLGEVFKAATADAITAASSGGTTPLHIFVTSLKEDSGFVRRIVSRTGGSFEALVAAAEQAVSSLPRQQPPPTEASPSASLIRVLQAAQSTAKANGDTVTSLAHLLLALVNDVSSFFTLRPGVERAFPSLVLECRSCHHSELSIGTRALSIAGDYQESSEDSGS